MSASIPYLIILFKLTEYHMISASEWCELGCEEADLDLYMNECRNACDANPDEEPKNKLSEYLNCMYKKCLNDGRGPDEDLVSDRSWLSCSKQCDREPTLLAHEATEKSAYRTQYLSDQQFENFKIISKMESKARLKAKAKLMDKDKNKDKSHKTSLFNGNK